jgi:thiol-disulfide isomerase/thioredoxin
MERLRGFAALMNNRRLLLLVTALVLVSAFGVGTSIYALRHSRASAANPASKSNVIRFVANPEFAPPFVLRDLDGKIVSTEDWKGKVVILNFWATWCPPCRQEIPEFIRLQAAYKDKLQIVGASEDDDPPQKVREFVQKIGMNYPVVMATKELADNYGGVPRCPLLSSSIHRAASCRSIPACTSTPSMNATSARSPAFPSTRASRRLTIRARYSSRTQPVPPNFPTSISPALRRLRKKKRCIASTPKPAPAAAISLWPNAGSTTPSAPSANPLPPKS